MGMSIDIIDRDVFLPFPKPYTGPASTQERQTTKDQEKKDLETLKQQMFDEKDKFILSDKNTFDIEEKPREKSEKKIKIPARYELIDKVNKWGVDIKNPTAVRG